MNPHAETRRPARGARTWALAVMLTLLTAAWAQELPQAGDPLGVGELVFVDVYRRPEVSTTTQIDSSGNITIPFVGNVTIAGLTESEASARVMSALAPVLKNPRVTVSRTAPGIGTGFRTASMKTEILPLQNSDAQSISVALQGMTSPGGTIAFDPDTNSLIITDTPDAIQNILNVTNRLDRMQSQLTQVRIEAKIAEVKVGAMKELGVRWFTQGTDVNGGYYPLPTQDIGINALKGQSTSPINNEQFGGTGGNGSSVGAGRNFVGGNNFDRLLDVPVQIPKVGQLFLGLMNEHVDLGLLLDALVADDQAELLANPNILTVNHKRADISMVDEFPFTEFGTETSGRSNFSVRFIDLGIKMGVTPHVFRDDTDVYVKLEFEPEVSYPAGASDGVPIRSVRKYTGESNVRDGQTLVVGGIYRNDLRDIEQRVPGLGKLPVLGNLFKRTEKANTQTELMIFLTPTVHDSPETVTWDRMLDVTANSQIVAPNIPIQQSKMEVRRQ
ncbi:MAG: polysaccharide biosynthesis/export family protein [Candidatus Hydrogenedentes bacterium]|nr:polysaccharide biosynthesis/export family protein [Candidatus Hydrogenedentota bacterium]